MKYNNTQNEAILHQGGPMMVLAGPGSGKTAVITKRVDTLIRKYGVEPSKILVVTFSKAAAVEMRERYETLAGHKGNVTFSTFHGFFFRILATEYNLDGKNIATGLIRKRFLEEAVADEKLDLSDTPDLLENISKEIGKVKNQGISIEHYYSTTAPEETFRQIYRGYNSRMKKNRLLDFDDMLLYTYHLFHQREEVLHKWQNQFEYILIDEFQDINFLQYAIIKEIAAPENNLFIVGDDDQSIYGFRGARPDIMLSFTKEFPEASQVILATNYRCSSQILNAAGKLIRHNKKRYGKELSAYKGQEEKVHICKCSDLQAEAQFYVDTLRQYHKEGIEYEQMAILFRTNGQARSIAGKFMENNIPFFMKEQMPNIFEHFIARDIMAYFHLGMGKRDRKYFLQISNRPKRYLNRQAFDQPQVEFADLYSYYSDRDWMEQRLDDFQNQLLMIGNLKPYAAMDFIRKSIGYDEFLEEYAKERGVNVADWLEILDEITESAKGKDTYEDWFLYVAEYTQRMEQEAKHRQERTEGVALMTMHGAKGLEFDVVLIPDVNEGVCPYRKAVLEEDMEEERRMLYVGMTRARKHLHITYLNKRYNKEMKPSRFLYEITPKMK